MALRLPWSRTGPNADMSLIAAARKLDTSAALAPNAEKALTKLDKEWQDRAWKYYGLIPIVGSNCDFIAKALRRVDFYPAQIVGPNEPPAPLTTGPLAARANAELDRLRGADGTFGSLIHDMAIQLVVPGEGYLVGWTDPVSGIEDFGAFSTDEMTYDRNAKRWKLKEGGEDFKDLELGPDDYVARFWQKHPRFHMRAHSGLQTVLDECEALLILKMLLRSTGRSRANNGLFLYPDNVNFPGLPSTGTSGPQAQQVDAFLKMVVDLFVTPLSDEGNALAVAPGVLKVPKDAIDSFKHLTFERKFDELIPKLIEILEKSIASGIDLPDSVVLGTVADANHWNAWFVDQDTYDSHLAPLVDLIASGVTEAFLRPNMADVPAVGTVVVCADATGIISHPNMALDADKGLELGAIGYTPWRKVKGYTEDDAPTDEDLALLERVSLMGRNRNGPTDTTQGAPGGARLVAAATPEPTGRPSTANLGNQLAQIDRDLMLRVHAASQGVVFRALEKAGAKMRRKMQGTPAMKDRVASVPNDQLCQFLGVDVVSAHFAEEELTDDLVAPIAASFTTWTAAAQRKVRKLAGDYGPVSDEVERTQDADRSAGLTALTAGLAGVVGALLFPSGAQEVRGEFDPNSLVPMGVVREALAVAGGADFGPAVDPVTGAPQGGVATGDTAMTLFLSLSVTPSAWVWIYTGEAPTPFPGHEALDGVEFLDWQDDVLSVSPDDAWLGVDFYAPGDHNSCCCNFGPAMRDDQADESAEGD